MKASIPLTIILILFSVAFADAQTSGSLFPEDLTVEDNVVYKMVDGREIKMAVFIPSVKRPEPSPCLIYLHGGGWAQGDRYRVNKHDVIDVIRELNAAGYVCVSSEYRLTDLESGITVMESVADCKDAVRFLMKNSERWNIDKNNISIFGTSAGAHLAMITAMAPDSLFPGDPELKEFDVNLRSAVAFYGPTSFIHNDLPLGRNRTERLIPVLGDVIENRMEIAAILSPAEHLTESIPPVLLVHGTNDNLVPPAHASYMYNLAREKNAPVEVLLVENAAHGLQGENLVPDLYSVMRFTTNFIMAHSKRY